MKQKKTMYKEVLDTVENFMIKSGIRDFCSKQCQGQCCSNCFTSEKACYRNEGRRLSCSIYLCPPLQNLIFTSHEKELYTKFSAAIKSELHRLMRKNIYYNIHTEIVRKRFQMNEKLLNVLNMISMGDISNRLGDRLHIIKSWRIKRSGSNIYRY
jgi:hypothetical protein